MRKIENSNLRRTHLKRRRKRTINSAAQKGNTLDPVGENTSSTINVSSKQGESSELTQNPKSGGSIELTYKKYPNPSVSSKLSQQR